MTPEQESKLFEDLGEIKANSTINGKQFKELKDVITGNGTPEEGVVFIMAEIRKGLKLLTEWKEKHECEVHADIDRKLDKMDSDNTAKEAIETEKKKIMKIIAVVIKHPVTIWVVAVLTGGWIGIEKEKIVAALTLLTGG